MRKFRPFRWKETNLKVACDQFDLVTQAIVEQGKELESNITHHPEFESSLRTSPLRDDAPEIAE